MSYLVPSEFVSKMVDAGRIKDIYGIEGCLDSIIYGGCHIGHCPRYLQSPLLYKQAIRSSAPYCFQLDFVFCI